MSMAMEGAHLAAPSLVDWAADKIDWPAATQEVAQRLDSAFAPRLRHARPLQQALFHPIPRSILWNLARVFPVIPSLLFRLTR